MRNELYKTYSRIFQDLSSNKFKYYILNYLIQCILLGCAILDMTCCTHENQSTKLCKVLHHLRVKNKKHTVFI